MPTLPWWGNNLLNKICTITDIRVVTDQKITTEIIIIVSEDEDLDLRVVKLTDLCMSKRLKSL